jgi:hypothetical protein
MTQYENILSKIAPVFYKLLSYEEDICSNCGLLLNYFGNAHVSGFCTAYHPMQNFYYYYNTYFANIYLFQPVGWETNELRGYKAIFISLKDKVKSRYYYSAITICDVFVNMVVNNFSFENEHYVPTSFKYLFQAAVGEETYETIRRNIK